MAKKHTRYGGLKAVVKSPRTLTKKALELRRELENHLTHKPRGCTMLFVISERIQKMKITNKIKWQDWTALGLLLVFLLIFPITNALLGGIVNEGLIALTNLIDSGFTNVSNKGMVIIQPIATILVGYVVWRVQGWFKVKTPPKTKNRKTTNKVHADLPLIES